MERHNKDARQLDTRSKKFRCKCINVVGPIRHLSGREWFGYCLPEPTLRSLINSSVSRFTVTPGFEASLFYLLDGENDEGLLFLVETDIFDQTLI